MLPAAATRQAHRSKRVRECLDPTEDAVQTAFLPPCSPDLNPVESLWAWPKRPALANFCPANLDELDVTARNTLKGTQHRPSIIAACASKPGSGGVVFRKAQQVAMALSEASMSSRG